VELISQRLSKPDCRINGWIIDGAPMNLEQTMLLKSYQMNPQLVITLEINDDLVYKRLEHRRFDPVTGLHHFLNQVPLPPTSVLKRLILAPQDTRPVIQKNLQEYRAFVLQVDYEFRGRLIRINGEDTNSVIFRNFCEAIENIVIDEKVVDAEEQAAKEMREEEEEEEQE